MIKIFVANKTEYPSSKALIEKLLREKYGEEEFLLSKTKNGKPFLQNVKNEALKFLSVSHTSKKYFIAFSPFEIGIDAELLSRKVEYLPVVKKFDRSEREQIENKSDFLKLWTARESAVKYLGEKLSTTLNRVTVSKESVSLDGKALPVFLTHTVFLEHILAVCQEKRDEVVFEEV